MDPLVFCMGAKSGRGPKIESAFCAHTKYEKGPYKILAPTRPPVFFGLFQFESNGPYTMPRDPKAITTVAKARARIAEIRFAKTVEGRRQAKEQAAEPPRRAAWLPCCVTALLDAASGPEEAAKRRRGK